jgi:hypothetical protein
MYCDIATGHDLRLWHHAVWWKVNLYGGTNSRHLQCRSDGVKSTHWSDTPNIGEHLMCNYFVTSRNTTLQWGLT